MTLMSRKKSLAVAVLAVATLGLPAVAQAGSYNNTSRAYADCKQADTENQILGGIIGAVAGGVVGSQVSGNGARTEGSVIGAAIGATAGAAIAGEKRDCKGVARTTRGQTYAGGRSYNTTYNSGRTYGTSRHYGSRHSTYSAPRHHYGPYHNGRDRVQEIKYRIEGLRAERRRLMERQHYNYRPHRARKIEDIGHEIRRLKKRKKRVKQRIKSRNHYYYR